MEKPRLSSKIEEVEYHGVKFKVKREFYVSDELGEYTTTEQDQKWWDDMKRQYYEYLGKVISDAKYLDILEFIDPLIIIKDKKDDSRVHNPSYVGLCTLSTPKGDFHVYRQNSPLG